MKLKEQNQLIVKTSGGNDIFEVASYSEKKKEQDGLNFSFNE